mgnify:CR=1 FL=1
MARHQRQTVNADWQKKRVIDKTIKQRWNFYYAMSGEVEKLQHIYSETK